MSFAPTSAVLPNLMGHAVQFQFDPEEPGRKGSSARRTLMLRNIPNKYTQAMLLEMLDSHSRCGSPLQGRVCVLLKCALHATLGYLQT